MSTGLLPGGLPAATSTDDNVVKHILKSIESRVLVVRRQRAEAAAAAAAKERTDAAIRGAGQASVIPPSAFAQTLPAGVLGGGGLAGTGAGTAGAAGVGTAPSSAAASSSMAVTDTLAAFVVRAVVLNPGNGFKLDAVFNRQDVERLIETSSMFIANDGHPESETVKMQVYFDSTFPQQAEYLHREKQARKATVAPILRDITDWSSQANMTRQGSGLLSLTALEGLYRKIVGYVLLKSAMGNPTDAQVAREASVALESVFPQSEVATFLGLARPDKEKQLNGLSQLVAGIRLFNRHVNRASKDKIENLPELCSREIKEAFSILQDRTKDAERKIRQLTAILSNPFMDAIPSLSPLHAELNLHLTQCLTFYRQLLIYLDAIREQLENSSSALRALDDRMATCLADLTNACRARSAVPVDQVYPKFMELAVVWQGFQDELFLDAFRRGVLDTLIGFEQGVRTAGIAGCVSEWTAARNTLVGGKDANLSVDTKTRSREDALGRDLRDLLHHSPEPVRTAAETTPIEPSPLPDEQIVSAAAVLQVELAQAARKGESQSHHHFGSLDILHPGNTAQYYKLPVEFGGFCPVTLVSGVSKGTVVPGNWNYGVVKYHDKLYAFRGPEEAKKFAQSPDQLLMKVLDLARERMGLVQLLQLYGYFPSIRALENAESLTRQALLGQRPLVCEAGTQVDTHLIDKWIDPKYEWNEWAMRRRALMLVNLRTKATHGAQTHQSHFRRDTHAQVFPPRDVEVQTKREQATGMPKLEMKLPPALLGIAGAYRTEKKESGAGH
ncbi:hypothetical protein BCR44DRAFT_1435103 [Catenaria anguillulae PL171]|uniref:Cilia- and flagella-associated protein 206 n=1 Tax=Catenaria anguillulae PL171 TaxID=765915 RepID=A0A1Y2HKM3_9FUNG|nr:hypothetical protein BCR44DRAFT_1435103 [Catenaria anguillulae PL171]